ncbi:MAG TPA: hypothetical protein VMZ91_15770, partial [Candidatus Paceibacterota bacterium]|nr:hypothetical protein [Candidatus Paceibacterota bacterium]
KKRILDEIIKTKQSIKIEELTSLLEFNDKLEMQKWLLLLNEKIPFIFDRENVYVSDISHELNISYSTVEESIDLLLESFNKKEKTGQSKKEN